MFLLSLCIRIQRNSTARIQYLKKRRKERIVYVVSEIRQKKRKEKSNNMAYPKEKRISKLVFPLSVKSKDK